MLKATVKQLCDRIGLQPRSEQGQNFLISTAILREEIASANLTEGDSVLDIGAGFGFLTERLATKASVVYAIERDQRIARYLRERLASFVGTGTVQVIVDDVLQVPLPDVSKIVSNPPYHIISPIVIKILREAFPRPDFTLAVLILQKTYAERLLADPGEETWGRLPAALQYFGEGELLRNVPRDAFWPKPDVPSALVKLMPARDRTPAVSFPVYEDTTRLIFSYPRKKVRNAVKIVLQNQDKAWREVVAQAEQAVGKWKRVRELRKRDIMALAEIFLAEQVIDADVPP